MNDTNTIRVIELCAGIGGFRAGLEAVNQKHPQQHPHFKFVYANDWQHAGCTYNQQKHRYIGSKNMSGIIYQKHYNDGTYHDQDIHTINPADIPDHDLLCAGFPCQPFSLAGKREGFRDIRGTLFFTITRILKAKKPKMLLLENVKGLLNHDNGDTFETIIRTLDELGYNVEWKVLNSKFFGVPQNRERIFIIGHLRGADTQQVFPIGKNGTVPAQSIREASKKKKRIHHSNTLSSRYGKDGKECLIEDALTGGAHSGGLHSQMTVIQIKRTHQDGNHTIQQYHNEVPTLTSQMGTGGNNIPVVHALYPRTGNPEQGGIGHLQKEDNNTYALDAHNSMGIETAQLLQTDGYLRQGSSFRDNSPQSTRNIRRLTPTECERLQGFPDGWTEGVSDTQRYKCLGNAVTVPVIKTIGELILKTYPSYFS